MTLVVTRPPSILNQWIVASFLLCFGDRLAPLAAGNVLILILMHDTSGALSIASGTTDMYPD